MSSDSVLPQPPLDARASRRTVWPPSKSASAVRTQVCGSRTRSGDSPRRRTRLTRIATDLILTRRTQLDRAAARLTALSPLAVLNRGYAIVFTDSGSNAGSVLRSAAQTQPGDQIRARLAHGTVTAHITAATVPTAPEPEKQSQ